VPERPHDGRLPAERLTELRELLRARRATRGLADGRFTPVTGGLSNLAWRVEVGDQAWFVRRGHPDAARLGVDRRSECRLLQTVSAAGLAPEVLACEPRTGVLVTRFIEGEVWRARDATCDANLRRIAGCLRGLHRLPVPAGVREVDYARQARRLAAGLPAPAPVAATLHARAARVFARFAARRFLATLCHNDLHHLNVVDDGERLWLVDWEYGGRGNPLFDVAGFLALHDLGPEPTRAFLTAYGRLQPEDLDSLDDARWLFDYVQWLWYQSRFPEAAGDEAWYVDRLAQRLLRCNN